MLEIPESLLDEIKEYLKERSINGEEGWSSASADEDVLTGAFLGSLKIKSQIFRSQQSDYKWGINYTKFRGRGPGAVEKLTGADGIITYEIKDDKRNISTSKSILFQAKKGNSKAGLSEQIKNMERINSNGYFVLRFSKEGYFAEQPKGKLVRMRVGDFLAEEFIECRTGVEGMTFDNIREILSLERVSLFRFDIKHKLWIKVEKVF